MENIDKYNSLFMEAFNIKAEQLSELEYQSIAAWDSVGHMHLMAVIEDAFEIELDTDDIIDFSSYEKGKTLLKKYQIDF